MTAIYALIPAAGLGARFNTDAAIETGRHATGNKVFATLGDRPLLWWTVAAFTSHPSIDGVLVVTGAKDIGRCRAVLNGLEKVVGIVAGGASRQDSVLIGMYALGAQDDDLVLVHDGARPLVSTAVIDRCIAGARSNGSAVAALPVVDTLKEADGAQVVRRTVPRDHLWAIQTPQAFPAGTLTAAFLSAREEGFSGTDEASVVERLGMPVHLVQGASENLKITRQGDLPLAAAILRRRQESMMSEVRLGHGYDVHRFVSGRPLILGGVEVPDPYGRGLDGHSDADVLLHALCDALLGAAGLPDIGNLYPNTDPQYAGIASTLLLADVRQRVEAQGLRVVNVDTTVIAESPKIAPHVPRMREAIAKILALAPSYVGIKATTNEGLGALGRGEGIAAFAVASLATAHL